MCCPEAHGKELGSPCASLWHTAKINGVELQPTAVNVGTCGARFAVCRGCGTRRTVASPCAFGLPCVYFLRTANWLFAVCPMNSTRQTLRHTANSRFPVVSPLIIVRELKKLEGIFNFLYSCWWLGAMVASMSKSKYNKRLRAGWDPTWVGKRARAGVCQIVR